MITGVNHLTLSVRDLDAALRFYGEVLGLRPIARWYKRAYLAAGQDWICLALDPETRTSALPEYTHLAFSVSTADFPTLVQRIQNAGAECWQANRSPGESFYFLDPDGHKLEVHVGSLAVRVETLMEKPPKDLVVF